MGANLTTLQWKDTSGDVIAPGDQTAEVILGVAWLGSLYGIAIVWTAVTLLGRWAGPRGEKWFNAMSVVSALVLSTAWPLVVFYMMSNPVDLR